MDVSYFLKERTEFIRFYYSEGAKPFLSMKAAIEEGAPPFDDPPYDEGGEPAFLEEWERADSAITMVGLHCVSMLSDSLKIYFDTLRARVLRLEFADKKAAFREGFPRAYREALGDYLGADWEAEQVNFGIIEQVVLGRNRVGHPEDLTDIVPNHDRRSVEKFPRPLFADESEFALYRETEGFGRFTFLPKFRVTKETLFRAIDEVEMMADVIDKKVYSRS